MKMTGLEIKPVHTWQSVGPDNPLRAVVKINSETSTVECVLSNETMMKLLDLCADEIAKNAKRQVDEFASTVTALDGQRKSRKLIGE